MKQRPERQWNHAVQLRPASVEEAGLFYSQVEEDRDWQSGTVGHVRMDFGHGGKEFWHTWWPHNQDQFNTPEFKETLQTVVDALRRDGPLKDLSAMRSYCQQHGGAITEDGENFGYIAETEHYQFCLRCTPVPGHYQGYLYCYDKRQQEMAQHNTVVDRVTYADGTRQEFTDSELYGRDDWGDLEEYGEDLDGRALRDYEPCIHETLLENQLPEEKSRGLMHWYDKEDGVNRKVQSVVFDVESRNGQLWAVAECTVLMKEQCWC